MRFLLLFLIVLPTLARAQYAPVAEERSPVPPWTDEEWEAVQNGDILPGYVLLYLRTNPNSDAYAQLLESDFDFPGLAEIPEDIPTPLVDESIIPQEDLLKYFSGKPESYLSDAQMLLSDQAVRDREAFLRYHADDSQIPIYIFLFRGEQEVPQEFPAQLQLKRQLYGEEDVVLVYYHLGQPEKSSLAMNDELRVRVSDGDYRRALQAAIAEAGEKSNEVDQLENFAVQLSIRLYWIERNLREAESAAAIEAFEEQKANIPTPRLLPQPPEWWEDVRVPVMGILALLTVAVLGFVGRLIAIRRRSYFFPEPDFAGRLGAPHAAGVGAVIAFHSKRVPPAAQKEEQPDYLETF